MIFLMYFHAGTPLSDARKHEHKHSIRIADELELALAAWEALARSQWQTGGDVDSAELLLNEEKNRGDGPGAVMGGDDAVMMPHSAGGLQQGDLLDGEVRDDDVDSNGDIPAVQQLAGESTDSFSILASFEAKIAR